MKPSLTRELITILLAAVAALSAPVFAATEGSTQRMKNVDIEADEILFFNQNSAVSGVAEFVLTNRHSDDSNEEVLFDGACGSAQQIRFEGGTISHMEKAKIATCEG